MTTRNSLAMYLMNDSRLASLNGSNKGVSYGKYNLSEIIKEAKKDLDLMKGELQNNLPFRDRLLRMGTYIFKELFRSDADLEGHIRILYDYFLNEIQGNSENSYLSFSMDESQLFLPVEFSIDLNKKPLAVQVPMYKTMITKGQTVKKRDEFEISNDIIKILLISSNARKKETDKIIIGNKETAKGFTLDSVPELDNQNNEIDSIEQIIKTNIAQINKDEQNEYQVDIKKYHTNEFDFEDFRREVSTGNYNIIHYNGHGIYDKDEGNESISDGYIFFWENKAKQDKLVGVNSDDMNMLFTDNNNLQLVYLSCCEGGASSNFPSILTTFDGLLHSTILSGVPAAIGMRWPIRVNDAKELACTFYGNLFANSHTSVETALMKARKRVFAYVDKSVWSSPILIKNSIS